MAITETDIKQEIIKLRDLYVQRKEHYSVPETQVTDIDVENVENVLEFKASALYKWYLQNIVTYKIDGFELAGINLEQSYPNPDNITDVIAQTLEMRRIIKASKNNFFNQICFNNFVVLRNDDGEAVDLLNTYDDTIWCWDIETDELSPMEQTLLTYIFDLYYEYASEDEVFKDNDFAFSEPDKIEVLKYHALAQYDNYRHFNKKIITIYKELIFLIANDFPILRLEKPEFEDVVKAQQTFQVNVPFDYLWFMNNGVYFDADEPKMLTNIASVVTNTLSARNNADNPLKPEYIVLTEITDESATVLNTVTNKVYYWEPFEDGDYLLADDNATDYLEYMIENLADLGHEYSL